VEDVKDVDLYKMVPFNCELPGTSQLQVSLFDYDMIGGDGRCFVQRCWLCLGGRLCMLCPLCGYTVHLMRAGDSVRCRLVVSVKPCLARY
jgi:hypothetical protein